MRAVVQVPLAAPPQDTAIAQRRPRPGEPTLAAREGRGGEGRGRQVPLPLTFPAVCPESQDCKVSGISASPELRAPQAACDGVQCPRSRVQSCSKEIPKPSNWELTFVIWAAGNWVCWRTRPLLTVSSLSS